MKLFASISRITFLILSLILAGLLFNSFFSLHNFCPFIVVSSLCLYPFSGVLIFKLGVILGIIFILLSFIISRCFCGFVCPLGTIQDFLIIPFKSLKIENKLRPKFNEMLSFVSLFVLIVVVIGTLAYNSIFCIRGCPIVWGVSLGRITIPIITIFILASFVISSIITERAFCRYFCPYGFLLSIPSRFSILKIRKNIEVCDNCGLCNKICPMGIDIDGAFDYINSRMCISCMKCLKICSQKGLEYRRKK